MSSGASTASGATASGSVLINGVDIGSLTQSDNTSNTSASNGRALQLIAAINAKTAQTGVTAAAGQTTNALTLTASDGRNIVVGGTLGAGLSGISAGTTLAKLQLTTANGATSVTINGPGTASIGIGWLAGLAANTGVGQTVSSIDLSSQTGSQSALSVLDTAIDTITNSRANLGAYQNRFEAAISNLQTTSTNLQASRSRILDTDYAKETTNLAKAQIVQQAATAMLAQANQSSQSVLALLK
jgi:flagellin